MDESKASQSVAKDITAGASGRDKRSLWICVLLVAMVAAAYYPVIGYQFIHFDDPDYVSQNPNVASGLSGKNISWALTAYHAGNWHPLTWMSHMLDVQLFGMNPGAHHATNVVFHIVNTVLLFLLLRRMTQATWPSSFVAALFGLHPLHVESVAWISERKDVLSTLFLLLTLWAYTNYVEKSKVPDSKSKAWYWTAFVLFAAGLMSKPMLVTLPFVLLLLDYWPFNRWPAPSSPEFQRHFRRRLIVEKLPFLILAMVSSVVTIFAQRTESAVIAISAVPIADRIENALASYVLYMKKMLWPTDLALCYPRVAIDPEQLTFAVLVLAIISVGTILLRRRRYLPIGWLWYLGTLVPVIGLVQVGSQALADRYTYVPFVGLFIFIAWGAEEISRGWRYRRGVLTAGSTAALAACLVLTSSQVRYWEKSETVFRHALAVTTNNALMHVNLGNTLIEQGKIDEAFQHYAETVRLWPDYLPGLNNLGFCLAAKGRLDEAIDLYRRVLKAKPREAKTHYLLGSALSQQGRHEEAITEYRIALEINPNHDLALNNLAWLRATDRDARLRNGPEAVRLAEHACNIAQFKETVFVGTLAAAYAEAGRFDDAVRTAERAIALATAEGKQQLADRNRQLLELYRARKPYHESPIH